MYFFRIEDLNLKNQINKVNLVERRQQSINRKKRTDFFKVPNLVMTSLCWAVANTRKKLPDSFLRAGRLHPVVHLRLPNESDREDLFQKFLRDTRWEEGIDFKKLVYITDGFSGAEIAEICHSAVIKFGMLMEKKVRKNLSIASNTLLKPLDSSSLYFHRSPFLHFLLSFLYCMPQFQYRVSNVFY